MIGSMAEELNGLSWAQQRVRDFHEKGRHPVAALPTVLASDRVGRRVAWMREEIDEFEQANTVVDQADAIVDLMYFALGTLVEMGVEGEPLFEIVHRANMRKVSGGSVSTRADGKIQKPADWVTPEVEMAAAIVMATSKYNLEVGAQDGSWAAISSMIEPLIGAADRPTSAASDFEIVGGPLDTGRDNAADDFLSYTLMSEADFQNYIDFSLTVYPVVVAGFRTGEVYRTDDPLRRYGIVAKRVGNRVLLIDPSPDVLGARSVNIDDLFVGIKSAFDGLHRIGPNGD